MPHPFLQSITDAVAGLSTNVSGLTSTVTTHTQTLSGHTQDIGNRLRKDVADTTPFTLGVAPAAAMTDALRKSDTVGGFMRPYRKFRSVGTADKGASVASGQTATITDPLGGVGVYEIGAIRVKPITPATVSTTITLKANGVQIWSLLLGTPILPAVGKITDVLSLGSALPADIALPTVLTVNCSSGVYDVTVDGLIVAPS